MVTPDGKTVRGDQRALNLMSAYGNGLGVGLGQVGTANKSNRITAIPELVDPLMGFPSGRRKQHALGTRHGLWRKRVPYESREYGAELRNPVPYRLNLLKRDTNTSAELKIRRLKARANDQCRATAWSA
ncbi:hypothetical protein ACAX43_00125 [Paraburkholderia sp. IW21]|uniref:hypothetical protein n=1 Tax=Paraburkholderia sp. IW21 TaxID=3242488 RepID=UPI0035220351